MKVPRPLQAASRSLFSQFARLGDGSKLPIQAGALPWRTASSGKVEVLLITSRSNGRWIIPKGQPMARKTLAEAAALEACEEAGVEGAIDDRPLGNFEHLKKHWLLGPVRLQVIVHALAVERVLQSWPEQHQRQRRWVSPDEGASLVHSDQLATLLRRFDPAPVPK